MKHRDCPSPRLAVIQVLATLAVVGASLGSILSAGCKQDHEAVAAGSPANLPAGPNSVRSAPSLPAGAATLPSGLPSGLPSVLPAEMASASIAARTGAESAPQTPPPSRKYKSGVGSTPRDPKDPCSGLEFCACNASSCEVIKRGDLCACDYGCPANCNCIVGGGTYLGCKSRVAPATQ